MISVPTLMDQNLDTYNHIRSGGAGFHEQKRGLSAVWGKEAVQFLNGLVTNDIAKLEDAEQMLAAFPNAQGRLLAVVRILKQGDKFLFETEDATHEKLHNNLFRFTFAGDFFVEDLTDRYRYFELFGGDRSVPPAVAGGAVFTSASTTDAFVPVDQADDFVKNVEKNQAKSIPDDLYEILRVESGIPKFGVDMDETTIVSELGVEDLISYTKGCYIGQEIIARIHFRGHVAKQLTGLILDTTAEPKAETRPVGSVPLPNTELKSSDGKNAGRITSVTYSPKLEQTIALGYVRYDYLAEGTDLLADGLIANVKNLPFIS